MEQSEILQQIHKITGKENIKFPSQIKFSVKGKSLIMHVKGNGVRDNMQTDGSAFEGWAICILACFPNEIDNLVLGWDKPFYSAKKEERNQGRIWKRSSFLVQFLCHEKEHRKEL